MNEKINALECLKEVLESYMEFCDLVKMRTDNVFLKALSDTRIDSWKPLLEDIKKQSRKVTSNDQDITDTKLGKEILKVCDE